MCNMATRSAFCSTLLVLGCADPPGDASKLHSNENVPLGTAHHTSATGTVDPEPVAKRVNVKRPPLSLVWLEDVASAEDGRGGRVRAKRALAFDVDAALLTPGARLPELRVGELVLTSSSYPRPGIIRFVLADAVVLPQGVPVTIGHAGEGFPRISVAASLEVPL